MQKNRFLETWGLHYDISGQRKRDVIDPFVREGERKPKKNHPYLKIQKPKKLLTGLIWISRP